ncbi:(2Fe-2S)-binding protein [Quisquiliibacterium transsilvanicum]|uniref:Isoquinoline 1-oxidoreductase alpha subunit n=1 Tax=Quisquiliibacterium transsilvanicum TaxID=1549638 RepID=A0A7W8HEU4_9BURK|nr:(2Fe-2S)-binding protein [Quisquiliibacterium transsilvanicum]MBB5270680.1 isoquinoline 1-oxidoreductase alpha subunit [Quisquiliibacterium transsilvanicum]
MTNFSVNGQPHRFDGDPDMPLLWYLRDLAGMTGTKYGCGQGLCGVCTVWMDGEPVLSCTLPMRGLDGRAVTTIEGLSPDGNHPVQEAWRVLNVAQCGYCQSGQIMMAAALLKTNPRPTDEQIDEAMRGNLCRCGTYPRVRAAIRHASKEA